MAMNEFEILTEHYESYDEEGRLLSKHGSVEYITSQKCFNFQKQK